MPKVDLNNRELTDKDGRVHKLSSDIYWHIVPNGGMLLHNAHIGEGIAVAMEDLLAGMKIKSDRRHQGANNAETIFENIRVACYPNQPSRLRCHFLFLSRDIAQQSLIKWGWEKKRRIEKCYLILSSGRFHYANIEEYEKSTRSDSQADIENNAHRYWQEFREGKFCNTKIEVLADSALYFPDWENFETKAINLTDLKNKPLAKKIEVFTENGTWEQLHNADPKILEKGVN